MKSKVNIARVAREAGVSTSTVSRILNGTAQVRPDKRHAVERVMSHLDYRPSVTARGLRRGRSMTIGVLTQDSSSPFFGEALVGIEQALDGSEYHAMTVSGHWREAREQEALDVILRRGVDALIVLGGQLGDEVLLRVARRLPLVAVGRSIDGLASHCLPLDNRHGQALAVRHLIDQGHRRIAYIAGSPHHHDARQRLAGYYHALGEAGLSADPALVETGDYTERSGAEALERLLQRRHSFSAVACANDQMAVGVRLALFRRGIAVPQHLSLVGYDDLFLAAYLTPPLTTVQNSIGALGQLAAGAALRLLAGESMNLPAVQARLVIRESVAAWDELAQMKGGRP